MWRYNKLFVERKKPRNEFISLPVLDSPFIRLAGCARRLNVLCNTLLTEVARLPVTTPTPTRPSAATLGPCSLTFFGSGSRSGSSLKMNNF